MEKDDEVKGVGNSLNFGSRTIYDPRLGRFNSVDPRARQYPSMSPYVYASDNPLYYNDEDGEGPIPFRLKDLLTENSSYLTGLLAGIGDGIIETIDLVAGMAQTSNAFNPIFNPIFFFSDEAKKIRSEAMETAKMALNALTNEDLRNKIWTNIKKEFGEWLDQTTFQGTAAEAGYQHGKLIFDGLTALVGVSEVKYLLKTGEFSLSGKKLLKALRKAKKIVKKEGGIIYKRIDKDGNIYIGQAKSKKRYLERQAEHIANNPEAEYSFEIIGEAEPGVKLDVLEESEIRKAGIPTTKKTQKNGTGTIQNKRYQMNEKRYRENGGKTDKQSGSY